MSLVLRIEFDIPKSNSYNFYTLEQGKEEHIISFQKQNFTNMNSKKRNHNLLVVSGDYYYNYYCVIRNGTILTTYLKF